MTLDTITLPAHWASALVNGDRSGMTDEDEMELDEWLDSHKGWRVLCTVDDTERFTWNGKLYGSHFAGVDVCGYDVDRPD